MKKSKRKFLAVSLVCGILIQAMSFMVMAEGTAENQEPQISAVVNAVNGDVKENSEVIPNDETGIPDVNLYKLILKIIDKEEGYQLTTEDAKKVRSLSNVPNEMGISGIKSLKGVDKLPLMEDINLYNQELESLKGIENCVNLVQVNISQKKKLTLNLDKPAYNITTLRITDSDLDNLEGLSNFPNLDDLMICRTPLTQIPEISSLTKLISLHVSDNQLESLSGIENLTQLKNLSATKNNLHKLPNMTKLVNIGKEAPWSFSLQFNYLNEAEFTNNLSAEDLKNTDWLYDQIMRQKNDRIGDLKNLFNGGVGTKEAPFLIAKSEQLFNLSLVCQADLSEGRYFKLQNDVDITELNSWYGIGFTYMYTPDNIFDYSFKGHFDGNNKTITVGNINELPFNGVFNSNCGQINNLHVVGNVLLSSDGGTLASNNSGFIEKCSSNVVYNLSINIGIMGIGGLVQTNHGVIKNSFNESKINSVTNIGGITETNRGQIINCYNSGDLRTQDAYIGGIAAINYGSVTNCYNKGNISNSENGSIGGIVGYSNDLVAKVINCYNIGNIYKPSMGNLAGGIIGNLSFYDPYAPEYIPFPVNCYYNEETTGLNIGNGNTSDQTGTTPLTTAQMTGTDAKTNMVGFDFDTVWKTTDSYPELRMDKDSTDNDHSGGYIPAPNPDWTWKSSSKGWWYENADGTYATNEWKKINGEWYYFGGNGYMATGWQKLGGTWYLLGNSGSMKTGWAESNGRWYYLKDTGAMAVGWVKDESGTWYYLNPNGDMAIGWIQDGKTWYRLDGKGVMLTGWTESNGKWYYLNTNGAMVTNTTTPDGYQVDSNGVLI